MKNETRVAIHAAKEAGKIAMKYYRKKIDVQIKTDLSPVTIADKLCDSRISSILKKNFPEHSILSEESGLGQGNDCKWIVDPLDGTRDFIKGLPFFGVLIGLEISGELACGVSYMPALGMLNFAEKGRGSFSNGKRIHVSQTDALEKSFVFHSSMKHFVRTGKAERLMNIICSAASSGSMGAIYPQMLVSSGIIDASLSANSNPWDLAAPKIIVEEAGGRLTDFGGNSTIYGGNAVATNGRLHEKIIEMLGK